MKILSITRDPKGQAVPDTFVVGTPPVLGEMAVEGPDIAGIKFQETGYAKGQAYRGPCYIVSFVESTVKRIIPAEDVLDIAVEMKPVTKDNPPELPE